VNSALDSAPLPASANTATVTRFLVTDFGSDGAVVYDTASGDTHLLDPLEAELLPMLVRQPEATAVALMHEFVDSSDATPDDEPAVIERIERALIRLRGLGLDSALPLESF
jgi:PqqD family protein of HPr-rel-A system